MLAPYQMLMPCMKERSRFARNMRVQPRKTLCCRSPDLADVLVDIGNALDSSGDLVAATRSSREFCAFVGGLSEETLRTLRFSLPLPMVTIPLQFVSRRVATWTRLGDSSREPSLFASGSRERSDTAVIRDLTRSYRSLAAVAEVTGDLLAAKRL